MRVSGIVGSYNNKYENRQKKNVSFEKAVPKDFTGLVERELKYGLKNVLYEAGQKIKESYLGKNLRYIEREFFDSKHPKRYFENSPKTGEKEIVYAAPNLKKLCYKKTPKGRTSLLKYNSNGARQEAIARSSSHKELTHEYFSPDNVLRVRVTGDLQNGQWTVFYNKKGEAVKAKQKFELAPNYFQTDYYKVIVKPNETEFHLFMVKQKKRVPGENYDLTNYYYDENHIKFIREKLDDGTIIEKSKNFQGEMTSYKTFYPDGQYESMDFENKIQSRTIYSNGEDYTSELFLDKQGQPNQLIEIDRRNIKFSEFDEKGRMIIDEDDIDDFEDIENIAESATRDSSDLFNEMQAIRKLDEMDIVEKNKAELKNFDEESRQPKITVFEFWEEMLEKLNPKKATKSQEILPNEEIIDFESLYLDVN